MDHSIGKTHSSPFSNIGPSLSATGKTFLTRTKQVFGKRLDKIPARQEKKFKSGLNTMRLGVLSVVSGGIAMGIKAGGGALLGRAHGAGVAVLVGGLVLGGSMILGGFAFIVKGHYDMNKAEKQGTTQQVSEPANLEEKTLIIEKTEAPPKIQQPSNTLVKPQLAELQNLPILKYVEPTMVENYCTTIGSIADLKTRIDQLQTILAKGDWEDPSLDEKLPEEQSKIYHIEQEKWDFIKEGQWDYTTPFIALAALAEGKITEAQFVQVQTYFSLRLQFPKEEIKVIKPPGLADDGGEEWKNILREVFMQSPYGEGNEQIKGMTEEEIEQFFQSLSSVPLGEQVLFTFKSPHQVKNNSGRPYQENIVDTVCAKIRYTPFRMFSYGARGNWKTLHSRMTAPLIFYQNAFKIFFPESYVTLRPQIGLSPIDAQYDRRSVDGQPGHVDVLTPFPGVFVTEADQHPAPGCEGMLHDIYHAFLTAAVPNSIRNFFLEETEKMCRDEEYARQKLKPTFDLRRLTMTNLLESWKRFVYDLEDLGNFCAKHFYGKERTPKKDLNLQESMSEFGQKEWIKGSRVKAKAEAEALGLFPTFIKTGPWSDSSGVDPKVSER